LYIHLWFLSFEQELRGTTGHIFILVSIQTSYIVNFEKKYVNSSFGHEKVMEKSWKIIFEKEWSP